MSAPIISKMPMMMNQMPSRTARTVTRGFRRDGDHYPRDKADQAEGDPPGPAFADVSRDAADERGQPLDYPGDADDQADERPAEVQMADQDDTDDDEHQAGDAEPDAVRFLGSNTRIRWNPREDHENAEQDRDHVQRARRVQAHDDPEDQGQDAERPVSPATMPERRSGVRLRAYSPDAISAPLSISSGLPPSDGRPHRTYPELYGSYHARCARRHMSSPAPDDYDLSAAARPTAQCQDAAEDRPRKGTPMTEAPNGPLQAGSPLRTPRAAAVAGILFSVLLIATLVLLRSPSRRIPPSRAHG